MIPVPILFILLKNKVIPHTRGQNIQCARELTAPYIFILQRGINDIGIGRNGIGMAPVIDDAKSIFLPDLINMHEGEVLVFILPIDIKDAGFDLDNISGKAA